MRNDKQFYIIKNDWSLYTSVQRIQLQGNSAKIGIEETVRFKLHVHENTLNKYGVS